MIPIKINSKKYKIKSVDELTTGELIELSKIPELTTVKYISWQTEQSLKDSFFAVVDAATEQAIGKIPDITKMQRPRLSYVDYSKTIQTVGQRHQIEESNLKELELLVFILAVSQARSNNIDDVLKLQSDYMAKPWSEILPAGFFFFRNLRPGSNFATRNFRKVLALISMLRKKSKQAAKN